MVWRDGGGEGDAEEGVGVLGNRTTPCNYLNNHQNIN
jgi:hypothetical protein